MQAIVNNVYTTFVGLTPEQRNLIDQTFAITIPGLFYNARTRNLILRKLWDGKKHYFSKTSNTLPTGLLSKALPLLPGLEIVNSISQEEYDNWQRARKEAQTVEVVGQTFSKDQRGAIVSAIDITRGILEMATNSGKTPVGAGIIKCLNRKTLWMIHRKALLHETSKRLEDYLGMPVGKIGDGYFIEGSLVTVGLDLSLKPKDKHDKTRLARYEVLIADEGHHLCTATQQKVAASLVNARYRFALGGTYPKDKIKLMSIMAMADATSIYKLTNEELIQSGWSATPKVKIRPIEYPTMINGRMFYGWDYDEAYQYAISDNPQYNEIVANDAETDIKEDKKTLIFVDRLAQGGNISQLLNAKGIENEFIHGSVPSFARIEILKKFQSGRLGCIISTDVLGEGVDAPAIGSLILAMGNKSAIRVLQRVGRALRKKKQGENIVTIRDYDHKGNEHLESHSYERMKIYKKQKFEVSIEQTIKL